MMPAGQTLEQVLTPETMTSVKAKVAELGLPLAPLQMFKPWALALTLQGLEWQKAGFDPELGLDKHFYDRAKKANLTVQGLETLAFQIGQFDGLSMPLQDRMLSETLKEMETTQDAVGELARAWKAGDAAAIEQVVLRDLKSEPQMYQRLLVDRNRTWLPKIEAPLRPPEAGVRRRRSGTPGRGRRTAADAARERLHRHADVRREGRVGRSREGQESLEGRAGRSPEPHLRIFPAVLDISGFRTARSSDCPPFLTVLTSRPLPTFRDLPRQQIGRLHHELAVAQRSDDPVGSACSSS